MDDINNEEVIENLLIEFKKQRDAVVSMIFFHQLWMLVLKCILKIN